MGREEVLFTGFLFVGVNHSWFYNYIYGFLKTLEIGIYMFRRSRNLRNPGIALREKECVV